MPEIGATLREARMRARIDVSEIEATTKIRAKYLRALENEEWGLLPGPTFVKSFLRTYAQALGLDGRSLVEEYRLHHERPSEGALEPIVSSSQRTRRRTPSSGPSRAYVIAVAAIGAVIVALIVALIAGGGSSKPKAATSAHKRTTHRASTHKHPPARASAGGVQFVTLSLRPSSLVYVCLIGDGGRKLIAGLNLQAGEATKTYRARRFEMTLGNSSITMTIDGRTRSVTPSSEAIGYTLTKAHGRTVLPASRRPTCK
jgi:cytoskeleton protein RodZ